MQSRCVCQVAGVAATRIRQPPALPLGATSATDATSAAGSHIVHLEPAYACTYSHMQQHASIPIVCSHIRSTSLHHAPDDATARPVAALVIRRRDTCLHTYECTSLKAFSAAASAHAPPGNNGAAAPNVPTTNRGRNDQPPDRHWPTAALPRPSSAHTLLGCPRCSFVLAASA